MEINPRIIAFLILVSFIILLAFGANQFLFPAKKVIPVNNTTNIQYVTVTKEIFVTPVPDGHRYFANEYQSGIRQLQRPFSWIRNDVVGKQDMKVTTIVYNYMTFDKLHWFNPTDYKYYEQIPVNPNNKFLIVFVYTFMDDIIGDDTRMWLINRSMIGVQYNNRMYTPLEYPYQIRYKELEESFTFDNTLRVQAFKQMRLYNEEEYAIKTAGETSEEIYYLRGGKSNAIDGYLIFEIPKNADMKNTIVRINFYEFGSSAWRLEV